MRVTIEGEAAQSLQESASLHGDTPAQRLGKAVNILEFLEKQELAGNKIMVLDPVENTMRHLLVFDTSPLDDEDHEALWEEHSKRWNRELDS